MDQLGGAQDVQLARAVGQGVDGTSPRLAWVQMCGDQRVVEVEQDGGRQDGGRLHRGRRFQEITR